MLQWALADLDKELPSGFGILKLIGNTIADSYLHFVESLPEQMRTQFARALVIERGHPAAAELVGIASEPLARKLIPEWDRFRVNHLSLAPGGSFPPGTRAIMRQKFQPTLGVPSARSPREWTFDKQLKTHKLSSHFDHGAGDALTYHHVVRDESGGVVLTGVSLMGVYGISSTRWQYGWPADPQACADRVRKIVEHLFLPLETMVLSL